MNLQSTDVKKGRFLQFCVPFHLQGSSRSSGKVRAGGSSHTAGWILHHYEADATELHRSCTKHLRNALILQRWGQEAVHSIIDHTHSLATQKKGQALILI